MAQIHNSELSKELIQAGRLQVNSDKIPNELAEKVVPVMEVNPKLLRRCDIIKVATCLNATAQDIYRTPVGKDFYLIGGELSLIKDATATSLITQMVAYKDNEQICLAAIAGFTLTAQAETIHFSLKCPIKLDRNSNISILNSTNVANVKCIGIVFGYVDESSNA